MPPWAMNPWMRPPPAFDENGHLSYDREEAERLLCEAERKAKREERRSANEVWEDHPARQANAERKRSPSRIPQRAPATPSSSSSRRSSRSRRSRRKRTREPSRGKRSSTHASLLPPMMVVPGFPPPP